MYRDANWERDARGVWHVREIFEELYRRYSKAVVEC